MRSPYRLYRLWDSPALFAASISTVSTPFGALYTWALPLATATSANVPPTTTPTNLPPTPTIVIDQPIVDTPTPRPVETSAPLQDPDEEDVSVLPIPRVEGFSTLPLRNACLYGAALMFSVFVFFGFLSVLRLFIVGFFDRRRLKRK